MIQYISFQKAEEALQFYKGNGITKMLSFNTEFEDLKSMIGQQKDDEKLHWNDICKF